MILQRGSLAFCIAAIATLLLHGPSPASETFDLSYISSDAVAAVVLQPRRTLTAPEMEMLPIEVIVAAGQQYLGIDPTEVEHAIGLLGLAGLANGQPGFGAILRFAKPYDQAAALRGVGAQTREATYAGKRYWQASQPGGFSLFIPDDRTLLVATDPMLRKMITAEKVDTPIVKLLRQTDTSKTAVAVLDYATLRPLVALALQNLPPLPDPFDQFLRVADLVTWVEVSLDFKGELDLQITIGANDAKAAEELKVLAERGKKIAREYLDGQLEESFAREDDPTQKALAQYLRRIFGKLIDGIDVEVQGDRIKVVPLRGGPAVVSTATTGVLVGLLLPAVQAAREAARRAQSMNNLKQIGLAMHNYLSVHGQFPPRALADKEGKPLLSWRVAILPFVDGQALYNEFHLDEPWDSEHNRKLIPRMPSLFVNPNLPSSEKTNYLAVVGARTFFGGKKGLTPQEITDGLSNTIMVVEADADRAVEWTRPDDLDYDPARPLAGFGAIRPGGFNALFADGSVRFISSNVDRVVLRALMTYAGGEAVALP
jgi:prepilin-type processing-associated H-X9-DG protein